MPFFKIYGGVEFDFPTLYWILALLGTPPCRSQLFHNVSGAVDEALHLKVLWKPDLFCSQPSILPIPSLCLTDAFRVPRRLEASMSRTLQTFNGHVRASQSSVWQAQCGQALAISEGGHLHFDLTLSGILALEVVEDREILS